MFYISVWNSNLFFCTPLPQKIVSLDKALFTLEPDPKEPQHKAPVLLKTRIGIKTRAAANEPLALRSPLKLTTFFSSQLSVSQEVLAQTPCGGLSRGRMETYYRLSWKQTWSSPDVCSHPTLKRLGWIKIQDQRVSSSSRYINPSGYDSSRCAGLCLTVHDQFVDNLPFFEWMTTDSWDGKG